MIWHNLHYEFRGQCMIRARPPGPSTLGASSSPSSVYRVYLIDR